MCETPASYTPVKAEWVPLDGLAHSFADFGTQATSPLIWQATGAAFLALSAEASAYLHDAFYRQHTGSEDSPLSVQGREIVRQEIGQAVRQWDSTLYWLERCANAHDPLLQVEVVRSLISVANQQRARLIDLDTRLLFEQAHRFNAQHDALGGPSVCPQDSSAAEPAAERREQP